MEPTLTFAYFKIEETTKNLNQVGRPRDLNPGPPEWESRALPRSHLARCCWVWNVLYTHKTLEWYVINSSSPSATYRINLEIFLKVCVFIVFSFGLIKFAYHKGGNQKKHGNKKKCLNEIFQFMRFSIWKAYDKGIRTLFHSNLRESGVDVLSFLMRYKIPPSTGKLAGCGNLALGNRR